MDQRDRTFSPAPVSHSISSEHMSVFNKVHEELLRHHFDLTAQR